MRETFRTRLLVIGGGPAGYTAAIYAARAALAPVLIEGLEPGGQLSITTEVENYPGFSDPVQGPELMAAMRAQAERVGARLVSDLVVAVDFSRRPFEIRTDAGTTWLADAVIVATGARAKWLGLPSEMAYRGFGVSACATCDGFFFRDRPVAVIGGGNTAVEEALHLARHASRVTLVHRRAALRAEKILQERLFRSPKIAIEWNSEVVEVLGEDDPLRVTGIRLRDVTTRAERTLEVDGVFVAIGHAPATEIFRGALDCDADGYVRVVPGTTRTSVPGVFCAGDAADRIYRQAVTAAGTGCMAALDAERFLSEAGAPSSAS